MPFNSTTAAEAGRKSKKPSPNSLTKDIRPLVKRLTLSLYDDIRQNLHELTTKDKAIIFTKLLEFQISKYKAIDPRVDISKLSTEEVEKMVDKIMNE